MARAQRSQEAERIAELEARAAIVDKAGARTANKLLGIMSTFLKFCRREGAGPQYCGHRPRQTNSDSVRGCTGGPEPSDSRKASRFYEYRAFRGRTRISARCMEIQ